MWIIKFQDLKVSTLGGCVGKKLVEMYVGICVVIGRSSSSWSTFGLGDETLNFDLSHGRIISMWVESPCCTNQPGNAKGG